MKYFQVPIFIFLLLSPFSDANADSVALPHSYTQLSPNGKFIFVMLAPFPPERDGRIYIESIRNEIQEIRAKYNISGLYKNDESNSPLWTVDWYSFSVEISSDGKHLIRNGPWARTSDQEAVSFFNNGKLLRTYKINELVDFPFLMPASVSHFRWSYEKTLDEQNNIYSIATLHGELYKFDIKSGDIISSIRTPRWIIGTFIFGALWFLYKRKTKKMTNH